MSKIKIIKYGSTWCGPCRAATEILKKSGVEFEEIDVDKNPDIIESKGIGTIPVLEFYDGDTLLYTHRGGIIESQLKEIISRYE